MFIYYVIIVLAVIAFAGQFAFTKKFESSIKQTTTTTLIMVIITSAFGSLMYFIISGFVVEFTWFSFLLATILAVIMIPYYMIGIKVLSYGSLAIYSMFMMLGGMLVPFFYGVFFRNEVLTVGKILGTVILTLCIVMQAILQSTCEENSNKKNKTIFFILCLLIFFINGATGVIANLHQNGTNAINEVDFTAISCGITSILGGLMLIFVYIFNDKKNINEEAKTTVKLIPLISMLAIGATAYTGSFLILKAASKVPASIQFPLISGGVIVLSALVSAFIYKEKLSKKEWIIIAFAFISTFLFAF